mmetsp:Transcript_41740/g.106824  ORF Transcript_41740/g.106824 Transcript_41740/m.106824 type:complete len:93 (+) Transcript_41740:339-617(+)
MSRHCLYYVCTPWTCGAGLGMRAHLCGGLTRVPPACLQALDACAGLEGQELEDCWASFNCNVEKVTNHYAKVAGVEPKLKKEADADKANGAE